MTFILAVCSGKGGVGKSTVSFYLSKLLTQSGYKVGLIDADICGPSLHLLFKELSVLKPEVCDGVIVPPVVEGVSFMSSAFYFPGGAFVRAPKANAIVKSFFENVAWPELDLIIVDFPPGTGDVALTLFQEVSFDGAFVVTTPHTLSVEDASKSCKMIVDASVPLLGVVENMAYFEDAEEKKYIFGKGGGAELKQMFEAPLLITVPLLDQENQEIGKRFLEKLTPCQKAIKENFLNRSLCKR